VEFDGVVVVVDVGVVVGGKRGCKRGRPTGLRGFCVRPLVVSVRSRA